MEQFDASSAYEQPETSLSPDDLLDALENNIIGDNFIVYEHPEEYTNTLKSLKPKLNQQSQSLIEKTTTEQRLGRLYEKKFTLPYNKDDFNLVITNNPEWSSFRDLIQKINTNYLQRKTLSPKPEKTFYSKLQDTGTASFGGKEYTRQSFLDTYELPAGLHITGIANDLRPIGWESNEQLAAARATSVKAYITEHLDPDLHGKISTEAVVQGKEEGMSEQAYSNIPGVQIDLITCGSLNTISDPGKKLPG